MGRKKSRAKSTINFKDLHAGAQFLPRICFLFHLYEMMQCFL